MPDDCNLLRRLYYKLFVPHYQVHICKLSKPGKHIQYSYLATDWKIQN